jgi:voltage-gated potassium channel
MESREGIFSRDKPTKPGFRQNAYVVIFGHLTPAGKQFDILLLWAILLSVLVVMLESVVSINAEFGQFFRIAEWFFTILFTIEYLMRIYCTQRPKHYIFSFFGIVDLLAILPTYLSLVLVGGQYFVVIRGLRLLRAFRVLKMTQYLGEAEVLVRALSAARPKITVFIFAVLTLVTIIGALMHLIEGPENGFTSIPRSVYWAIVTLTTVGYGDIAPQTVLGQSLAALVMIMGYAILAVPTGIVSVEISQATKDAEKLSNSEAEKKLAAEIKVSNILEKARKSKSCTKASHIVRKNKGDAKDELLGPEGNPSPHDKDAAYCKYCGELLELT